MTEAAALLRKEASMSSSPSFGAIDTRAESMSTVPLEAIDGEFCGGLQECGGVRMMISDEMRVFKRTVWNVGVSIFW
jgi:hypothetical protein